MAANGLLVVGGALLVVAAVGAIGLRIGLSVVPLYVLGGVVAGPHVLGVLGLPSVARDEVMTVFAELGIVLLLFFLGLEFSVERLLAARDRLVAAGAVDLAVNFPLGVGLGLALGWSAVEALLLGGIVYISSSAIITKSLIDLGWIADPEAEPILGILVFEDLAVALYLAVVASLIGGGGGLGAAAGNVAVALGFLAILGAVVVLGGRLFDRVLDVDSDEQFVLRALAVVVPVAGAALAVGASEAVAAFFVGMGFATTEHAGTIERRLTPVRDVFAAVFFFWIGLGTDPRVIAAVALPLAVAVLLTTPAKLLSGYYGGRLYGLSPRRSIRVGVGTVARGEFSLVIAAAAATGVGPVQTEIIPALAVGYVLAMSVVGTVLMQRSDAVEGAFGRLREGASPESGSDVGR
jgi:CPA2 family monovalent cation:H+ antiporter-2